MTYIVLAAVLVFILAPYLIFKFVVAATESEMPIRRNTPSTWYGAAFKSSLVFLAIGPPIAYLDILGRTFLLNLFNGSPIDRTIGLLLALPLSYLFGFLPALEAGAAYGLVQSIAKRDGNFHAATRIALGGIVGLIATQEWFAINNVGATYDLWKAGFGGAIPIIPIGAIAGMACGYLMKGKLHRWVFKPAAFPPTDSTRPNPAVHTDAAR